MTVQTATPRPAIRVTKQDYEQLNALVEAIVSPSPGATLLTEELDRAVIVGPNSRAEPFVRLNSRVEYEDTATGQVRSLRVVLPKDARVEDSSISVLSPAGAALLGLKVGQSMHWVVADGRQQTLKVLSITD
jgi:regulator of nucleoside diphosphate kinase